MSRFIFAALMTALSFGFIVLSSPGHAAPGATPQIAPPGDRIQDAFFYDGGGFTLPDSGTGQVALSFGDGELQMQPARSDLSPNWDVYTGFFNADTFTDLFLYNREETGIVLFSDGAGGWIDGPADSTFSPGWEVFPGNFNNTDSLTDLFLYNYDTGTETTLIADGQGGWTSGPVGTFDARWHITTGHFNSASLTSLHPLTDLYLYNGDYSSPAQNVVLFATGDGNWDQKTIYQDSNDWLNYAGDFNGDGLTDIFSYDGFAQANPAKGIISFATGTGTWTFCPVNSTFYPFWDVFPGDFDGDGATDLFLYGSAIQKGTVLFSDKAGGWTGGHEISFPSDLQFVTGRFNDDDRTDLLVYYPGDVAMQKPAETSILRADGQGTWVTDGSTPTSSNWQQIVAGRFGQPTEKWGDFDCDGEITPRDGQAILKLVLNQTPLSQTQPCSAPSTNTEVFIDGLAFRLWGDNDCKGEIAPRDGQAVLKAVLQQPPLSQTEPCPDIGDKVFVMHFLQP